MTAAPALAALVAGTVLLLNPDAGAVVIAAVLGGFWLVAGAVDLATPPPRPAQERLPALVAGALGVLAGLMGLAGLAGGALPGAITLSSVAVFVLGVCGMSHGAVDVARGVSGAGAGVGLLGVLSVLLGFVLLFQPLAGVIAVPLLAGALVMAFGLLGIAWAVRSRKTREYPSLRYHT